MNRPRLLIITTNQVGVEMAGPGIRAYELARVLAPHAEVTLAARESEMTPVSDVDYVPYTWTDPVALRPHVARSDAIFAQPQLPALAAWMRASGARLIFDLYYPEPLEALQNLIQAPSLTLRIGQRVALDRILDALHAGHNFVCSTERQRDLWLGTMMGEGLIRPAVYERDPTFRSVIDASPFGLPREPPVRTGPGARESLGLADNADVLLWNGGIWNWLDAPTAIRALALLRDREPERDAHLVFMASPNPASQKATDEAKGVARELGVLGTSVHFTDRQIPYTERGAWMLDADCAVYAHQAHLESHFAYRTRILDCLWAGVPVVCARGDHFADAAEREGWGVAADPQSPESFADALSTVLGRGRERYAEPLRAAAERQTWDRVASPIVRWVTDPEVPPRLGGGASLDPGRAARRLAFRAARRTLNTIGMRNWPAPQ